MIFFLFQKPKENSKLSLRVRFKIVARIYTPDGKRLNSMQRGLNIIVFDDGTVHKFLMK